MLPETRYRLLDAWRGVACLIVVVYHAGFALDRDEVVGNSSAGWARWGTVAFLRLMSMGVPFFFVISGYCIAASADSNRRREHTPWSFLRRRFWRIYPPYWVAFFSVLALVMVLDVIGLSRWHLKTSHALNFDRPGAMSAWQWVGNLTLIETWRPLLWGGADHEPFTRVAWTLCYEEQFYMVCFLILWLAPRRLFGAMAGVSVVVIGLRAWASWAGFLDRIDGSFVMRWHEFAVGLAVFWRLNGRASGLAKRSVELSLIALTVIGLVHGLRQSSGAAAFGLVLIALRRWDGFAESTIGLRALSACGRRCYSIYLAHLPVCTLGVAGLRDLGLTGFWTRALLVVPLVSLAATAVGWLFFAIVEARLHSIGHRFQGKRLAVPSFGVGTWRRLLFFCIDPARSRSAEKGTTQSGRLPEVERIRIVAN
jgi:peptidoglycan/LPS O-acetylase OafA/YrhL